MADRAGRCVRHSSSQRPARHVLVAERLRYLLTEHIAPVVDGEWTNYTAHKSECWPDARTTVPAYLGYLAKLRVGMTVWGAPERRDDRIRQLLGSDAHPFRLHQREDSGPGPVSLTKGWYKLRTTFRARLQREEPVDLRRTERRLGPLPGSGRSGGYSCGTTRRPGRTAGSCAASAAPPATDQARSG